MRYSYMFLSVLMLSRYNYLESNYIHYFQPVVGFLIDTLEERWIWRGHLQRDELGENRELALVLSHLLRGLRTLRLLCQIDIRSEEELICIACLMQHTLESCVVFVIGYQIKAWHWSHAIIQCCKFIVFREKRKRRRRKTIEKTTYVLFINCFAKSSYFITSP